MSDTVATPADWVNRYRDKRSMYEDFATRVAAVLADVIRREDLDVILIEHRAKTVESFRGKLDRKGNRYGDPLREVTDLAGIRVITYYLEDVATVEKLLRREFTIDDEHSIDKATELDSDRFGYLSNHYIVSVGDTRGGLPEWAHLKELKAEIQVRTATQHAWASIEHKVRYKSERNFAPEIGRRLSRLSALFELADEQFAMVRQVTRDVERGYKQTMKRGDLDVALDASSLEVYLNESEAVQRALDIAGATGWAVQTAADPFDPDRQARDAEDLMRSLRAIGVATVGDLHALVQRADEVTELLAAIADREAADPGGSGHPDGAAFREDILNIVVFLLTRVRPEVVSEVYGGVTAAAINDAIASTATARPMVPQPRP